MTNFLSTLQANSVYGALRGLEVHILNEYGFEMVYHSGQGFMPLCFILVEVEIYDG